VTHIGCHHPGIGKCIVLGPGYDHVTTGLDGLDLQTVAGGDKVAHMQGPVAGTGSGEVGHGQDLLITRPHFPVSNERAALQVRSHGHRSFLGLTAGIERHHDAAVAPDLGPGVIKARDGHLAGWSATVQHRNQHTAVAVAAGVDHLGHTEGVEHHGMVTILPCCLDRGRLGDTPDNQDKGRQFEEVGGLTVRA